MTPVGLDIESKDKQVIITITMDDEDDADMLCAQMMAQVERKGSLDLTISDIVDAEMIN